MTNFQQATETLRETMLRQLREGKLDATPYLEQMSYKSETEKVKQEIKVLEKKLALLEEIEKHKSQPRMEFDFGGEFEVVTYNDVVYYRLEFTDEVYWYKRKYRFKDGMMLVHITDGETHRLLEGLWFNDVKRGQWGG